jgi:ATP-dependent protease ClpP protease subunit
VNLTELTALADAYRALAERHAPPKPRGGDWYRITAQGDTAEVFLYDVIGYETTADTFVRELAAIDAPAIDVRVNSLGGLVWDGTAIYAALRNHPARITVRVDGIAASAASFVAMAGDEIVMERPARMMIHNAQGIAIGDPTVMREMADLLDELSDGIADIYAERAGGDRQKWRKAMNATTWYSAQQAVEARLADRVAKPPARQTNSIDQRTQQIRARARATLERVR